ncbi:MAG: hypothetical protein HQ595_00445, partial [Candidatus Omnitrophica bacterium]|nr:hypothetical protein [Candidatus Omnitrophota bacterium]
MKKQLSVLMAIGLCVISLCVADLALARSETLTSIIVVTVKPLPKTNLSPSDNNAGIVNELAIDQAMSQPYIKVAPQS